MDAATRILFDSLGPGSPSLTDARKCDWEAVWTKARDHGLVPYLDKRWTESGFVASVPRTIRDRFSNATLRNHSRNMRLLTILDNLNKALQEQNVPVLVSKGFPVGQTCYGDPGLRVPYDLDLLIKTEDKSAALELLQCMGYVPFYPAVHVENEQCLLWKPKTYDWGPEAIFDPEAPCFVELHTKAWEPHWHGFRMDCNLDLWTEARLQNIAGIQLRFPSEEKLLVHLAVHYACNVLESNARLMHLLDIILLLRLRASKLRWELLWDDIKNSNAAAFCFLAFELARQVGTVGIPDAFWVKLRCSTPNGIIQWVKSRGIEDVGSINPREFNRTLIYLLHWNMAANWSELAGILLYSLRTPWQERTGVGRLTAFAGRMAVRLVHLARACRRHAG